MTSTKPYTIAISDDELRILKDKLALTRFPDELGGAGWDYGAPLGDIARLVKYWQSGFDWRKQEAQINAKFSQFTTDIEVEGEGSLNIHFIHHKGASNNSIPLLFVHGCSSFLARILKAFTDLSLYCRAWGLLGGCKDSSSLDTSRRRPTCLSRRRIFSPRLWFFRGTQEDWLRHLKICRGRS